MAMGCLFPFTIVVSDPAGNSFVQVSEGDDRHHSASVLYCTVLPVAGSFLNHYIFGLDTLPNSTQQLSTAAVALS